MSKWLSQLWQRFLDDFVSYVSKAILASLSFLFVYYFKDWLLAPIPVLPAVLLGLIALIIVLSWSIYRAHKPKPFKPFNVHEQAMDVFWWIQKPPNSWIDRSLENFDNLYIDEILSGPFCAIPQEDGKPCQGNFASLHIGFMKLSCDSCNRNVFETLLRKKVSDESVEELPLPELKRRIALAIQRDVRRGVRLQKGMRFQIVDVDLEKRGRPPVYG